MIYIDVSKMNKNKWMQNECKIVLKHKSFNKENAWGIITLQTYTKSYGLYYKYVNNISLIINV